MILKKNSEMLLRHVYLCYRNYKNRHFHTKLTTLCFIQTDINLSTRETSFQVSTHEDLLLLR